MTLRWRRTAALLCLLLLAGLALVLAAGEVLSRPAHRPVGPPPAALGAATVRIPLPPSAHVTGWWSRGTPGAGAVLLLHGVRADRRQMLARALALQAAGYAVLLIDLPAHGESPGERIGFGAREAAGVLAALAFLRAELPGERVGVVAVSLGAAAIVLARPHPAPSAVVLESMYPDIGAAVANRLAIRLGALGPPLAPLLLWQLPWRVGVEAAQLRPIDALPALHAPVLVAAGQRDRHTTWAETQRIHAAAAQPEPLWGMADAGHVDLHRHDPRAYEAQVFDFLSRHLRGRN